METGNNNDKVIRYWDASWPEEVPKHIDYEEITLGEILRRTAKTYPDSEVVYFEGFRMAYRELDSLVDQFATALSKMGIKKGDVVLIDVPNIPQYLIAHFATVRLGAVSNPVLPVNRFVEIVHQVNDSNGKLLIILDYLYDEYLQGKDLSKMPSLEHIILTGLAEYLPKVKAKLGTALGKIPRMKEWPIKIGKINFHAFQEVLQRGIPVNVPKVSIDIKKDTWNKPLLQFFFYILTKIHSI